MTTMISLDTSTNSTGYAVYMDGKLFTHGIVEAFGDNSFDKMRNMIQKLHELLDAYEPTIVITETTAVTRNAVTQRNLTMLLGAVLGWCVRYNMFFDMLRPPQWRSLVCGETKPPRKRDGLKKWSKDRVKELFNIELNSDDIADAILIGYAYIQLFKGEDEE